MKHGTQAHSILAALFALTILGAAAGSAAAQAPAHHVRGTIADVAGNKLTVATRGGSVTVAIGDKTKVVGLVPTTAAEITSGSFIGVANVPLETSTSSRALEVVIFPASMTGVGEGDYPWDLAAGRRQASSMTNGTVEPAHGGSMMTNGTVMGVNNRVAKHITMQYKGGSKAVTIPPGTPVNRIVAGSRAMLTRGAHVVVFPAPAGADAPFVIVGEHGVVPPM